jgi:antitoxin (DNA-binding transcriptional repressor) of toxin-antitoxin stability system
MNHMRKVSVRDLRYRFAAIQDLLHDGEEIQITKRKRVIARLIPASSDRPPKRPDFLARLKRAYRGKPVKVSGADMLARERERF